MGWVITTNADGVCGRQQPTGGLTAQVSWLVLRVGGRLALTLHSLNELGELLQWLSKWQQHQKHSLWYHYSSAVLYIAYSATACNYDKWVDGFWQHEFWQQITSTATQPASSWGVTVAERKPRCLQLANQHLLRSNCSVHECSICWTTRTYVTLTSTLTNHSSTIHHQPGSSWCVKIIGTPTLLWYNFWINRTNWWFLFTNVTDLWHTRRCQIDHHTFTVTSCTNRIKHRWTKINSLTKTATKINNKCW